MTAPTMVSVPLEAAEMHLLDLLRGLGVDLEPADGMASTTARALLGLALSAYGIPALTISKTDPAHAEYVALMGRLGLEPVPAGTPTTA